MYLMQCDCGISVAIPGNEVKIRLRCKSCSAASKSARMIQHGGARKNGQKEQIYNLHQNMMRRCYSPRATGYQHYGGQGIGVCEAWHDYSIFRAWVLETRPVGTKVVMDRIDVLDWYSPGNVQWITQAENNRRMLATYENVWIGEPAKPKPPNVPVRRYERHGLTVSHKFPPLYRLHTNMFRRCYAPKSKNFARYGGRGIKICADWHRFSKFSEWAWKNGYEVGLTIDRIDPNGDYEPFNCEWVTGAENARRMNLFYRKVSLLRGAG